MLFTSHPIGSFKSGAWKRDWTPSLVVKSKPGFETHKVFKKVLTQGFWRPFVKISFLTSLVEVFCVGPNA